MRVRVEVWPWLSNVIYGKAADKVILVVDLPPHSTLKEFIGVFMRQHRDVAGFVIDGRRKVFKPFVNVILNDRAFELSGGYGAVLNDGDVITLLAAYTGG
ncbi:MAG: MoaD/ThiS family protein [Eubacteriales bacterium]